MPGTARRTLALCKEAGHVGLGAGEAGHARAGEGDLGGGGELEHHVGASRLRADGQDVREAIMGPKFRCVADTLDKEIAPLDIASWRRPKGAVGVVPHDEEIRRGGRQGRQAADGLLGVDDPLGVGVLRSSPPRSSASTR